MCNMIPLQPIADANLVSTNVPENDHAAWDVGTTYANGDRVISVATHSVFESTADGNTGNDPDVAANVDPATGTWVRVGSTNRWRAFDRAVGQSVTQSGSIKYTLETTTQITALGLKGVQAASARLRVLNPDAAQVNLLPDSETSTGMFVQRGSVTDSAANGRSGLNTMVRFTEDTVTGQHYVRTALLVDLSGDLVFSVDVRAGEWSRLDFGILIDDLSYTARSTVDLVDDGAVLTSTAGTGVHASTSITQVETGIYRLTTVLSGAALGDYRMQLMSINDLNQNSYTGDGTSGFWFGRMQIEAGAAETSYQQKAAGAVVATEEQNLFRELVDSSGIRDWFDLVTFVPDFVPDVVFENLIAFVGYQIEIELDGAGGTTELAELGWGRRVKIGDSVVDTSAGFRDKSTRTEDAFGNLTVVPRETYDVMRFRISRVVGTEENTRRILAQQGKGVCFYYADASLFDRAPLVLGYRPDFDGPLAAAGRSFATLEVRGLI